VRVLDLFHTLKPSTYVERIPNAMTHDFILNRHYARRLPSISYAFGLFYDGVLEGICTFGTPSSAPLRTGICGKEYSHLVIELNRLFLLNNKRNDASRLIGASLRMLPKPRIIVSFADMAHGHTGGGVPRVQLHLLRVVCKANRLESSRPRASARADNRGRISGRPQSVSRHA